MVGTNDTSDRGVPASRAHPHPRRPHQTITIRPSSIDAPQNVTTPYQGSSPTSSPSSPTWRGRSRSIERRPLLPYYHNSSSASKANYRSSSSSNEEALFPSYSDHGDAHRNSSEIAPFHRPRNDDPFSRQVNVDHNPFAFSPGQLSEMFNLKNLETFRSLGGLRGLVLGLRTDSDSGLSLDETTLDGTVDPDQATMARDSAFIRTRKLSLKHVVRVGTYMSIHHVTSEPYADRKRVFGINRLPERRAKSLWQIMWITYNDKVLIILTIVAAISLILGLYQDFGQSSRYKGPKVRWVEGATIMVAVAIVVVVGSLNNYQKEQQFRKLNKKKADRMVNAIRSGKAMQISVYDVLIGDVLHLEAGAVVPADGVLISGHNLRCDESSITGESDPERKMPGHEVWTQIEAGVNSNKLDPFIISGSKVLEGAGTYLVTGVGVYSNYGKLMTALTDDEEETSTPLQERLNVMTEQITKFGCTVALFLFVVLFIKFLTQLGSGQDTPTSKVQDFLQIVIVAITIIVIAVPEGLPLAVTLALAIAMTRMLKDQNLVRVLSSCETMGNATVICSDKTGTLTMNKMTVTAGTLGSTYQFGAPKVTLDQDRNNSRHSASAKLVAGELTSLLSTKVKNLLSQSITINSTAFEGEEDGRHVFIGSKTEAALLSFAEAQLGIGPVNEERSNANVIHVFPFDSRRKCMASVIKLSDNTYRMFVKGASEVLLAKCTRVIEDPTQPIKITDLTEQIRNKLAHIIYEYATKSLRTIGLVYRDFSSWPLPGVNSEGDLSEIVFEDMFEQMIFLGIMGIQDPLRPSVKESISRCQHAGVAVRMVTGDNIWTAKSIATECGIYTQGGIILEGPEFRRMSSSQMDQIIPQLQVLARSSPEDKRILVKRLRELGEVVAVTGDGTNDGPALKAADIGFSMGISGTEVAKEASSIILMDDNFSSIVKALEWGRTVNDAVRKFLQFQLTVNITAVGVTFVSAIANPNEEPLLTPVQLLWVNLIMDTFAALALATDPPNPSILNRKPEPKSAPLITLNMWKMIIGQSLYQLTVTLVLNFAGNGLLGYKTEFEKSQLETLVFNVYIWMQIFNQLNNRRLDNKLNIFEGIQRNWFFIGINVVTVCGQIIIISVGSSALSTIPLDATQWGISIILGAISLPVAVLIRLVPNDFIQKFIFWTYSRNQIVDDSSLSETQFKWNDSLTEIHKQLTFYKLNRSSRIYALICKLQWPRWFSSNRSLVPDMPNRGTDGNTESSHYRWKSSTSNSALAPAAAMAGVVAGSIAGWSPVARGTSEYHS